MRSALLPSSLREILAAKLVQLLRAVGDKEGAASVASEYGLEAPPEELSEAERALVTCTTLWASPLTRALQTALVVLAIHPQQD